MDYENELNKRLETRFIPSAQLQPLFDVRSTATRYTHFKTHEEPKNLDINTYTNYSQENVFNPGDRAPVDYFFKSVDVESTLRSQFMALQKSNQAVYVPDTSSDLYNYNSYEKRDSFLEVTLPSRKALPEKVLFNNMTRLDVRK
jgi:hypothetical protein